jgi:hypothetical protein
MFALTKLWQSIANLVDNLNALALTVGTINDGLRQRVGLDGTAPAETGLLERRPVQDGTEAPAPANGPAERSRRGRKGQDAV